MKIKYLVPLICIFSIVFADSDIKKHRKRWHKKHHKVHERNHGKYRSNSNSHLNIRYGYHWCFTPWRNFYPIHDHNNVVVIRDEEVNAEDYTEIFSQIEKLGELKENGLLTEKEFEKAKKDLLKKL